MTQSGLKIGCQGWIAWLRVSKILIVLSPPCIEDFVNYSLIIVVYQRHPLFSCVEFFQVFKTVSVFFCASMIFCQYSQKISGMRRIQSSVWLSHQGGLRRASCQPKEPFWEINDQMKKVPYGERKQNSVLCKQRLYHLEVDESRRIVWKHLDICI